MDAILEATGDLLLAAGTDGNQMVPNPGVDCTTLNLRVEEYQAVLNDMEMKILEAMSAQNKAKESQFGNANTADPKLELEPPRGVNAEDLDTSSMPHFDFDTFADDFQGLPNMDGNGIFDF